MLGTGKQACDHTIIKSHASVHTTNSYSVAAAAVVDPGLWASMVFNVHRNRTAY